MPPNQDQNSTVVLVWSDDMVAVFLRLLEEQHDIGKRSDTGFKPKLWNIFREGVQKEYKGTGNIMIIAWYCCIVLVDMVASALTCCWVTEHPKGQLTFLSLALLFELV